MYPLGIMIYLTIANYLKGNEFEQKAVKKFNVIR